MFVTVQTSSYSGATLLGRLLGAHPEVATIGEMDGLLARNDPELYLCSCGQRIRQCEFWQAVQAGMRSRGYEFDVADFGLAFRLRGPRAIQWLRKAAFQSGVANAIRDTLLGCLPDERRRMEALVARNLAFIETVLALTGKRVFVDTSKDRLRFRALRRHSSLDVRAIHLVRDVRGVVASRLRRGRISRGVDRAARDWSLVHGKIEVALAALPAERRIQVRYEDLCRDVPGTLARLYEFCGVAAGSGTADLRRSPHHLIGNRMRLSELVDLGDVRTDERWRNLLANGDLEKIERSAGSLGRRYGYFGTIG